MGEVCVGGGDYASLIVIAPHFPKNFGQQANPLPFF